MVVMPVRIQPRTATTVQSSVSAEPPPPVLPPRAMPPSHTTRPTNESARRIGRTIAMMAPRSAPNGWSRFTSRLHPLPQIAAGMPTLNDGACAVVVRAPSCALTQQGMPNGKTLQGVAAPGTLTPGSVGAIGLPPPGGVVGVLVGFVKTVTSVCGTTWVPGEGLVLTTADGATEGSAAASVRTLSVMRPRSPALWSAAAYWP